MNRYAVTIKGTLHGLPFTESSVERTRTMTQAMRNGVFRTVEAHWAERHGLVITGHSTEWVGLEGGAA